MTTLAPQTPAPTFTLTGTWSESALSALADILLRATRRELEAEKAKGEQAQDEQAREKEVEQP